MYIWPNKELFHKSDRDENDGNWKDIKTIVELGNIALAQKSSISRTGCWINIRNDKYECVKTNQRNRYKKTHNENLYRISKYRI